MKKFLFGIVLLLIISGCTFKNETTDQIEVVESTSIEKEEVIEYNELLDYTDSFKVGDIINIENTNYLISYAIPGKWKHTVFYLGTYQQFLEFFKPGDRYYQDIIEHYKSQKEVLVLDSNSSGVKIRTFDQMANLKEESYLKALSGYRFNEDDEFIKTYINHALDYLGIPYDYSMITYDDTALYCSELVYYALQAVNIEINKVSKILDHDIITPSDLGDYLETLDNVEHCFLLEKIDNCIIDKINN